MRDRPPSGDPADPAIPGDGPPDPLPARAPTPVAAPEPADDHHARQLAAIEQTYPGWRIEIVRIGARIMWKATRHGKLTERQRAAGLRAVVMTATASEMVTTLSHQDGIQHQTRGIVR